MQDHLEEGKAQDCGANQCDVPDEGGMEFGVQGDTFIVDYVLHRSPGAEFPQHKQLILFRKNNCFYIPQFPPTFIECNAHEWIQIVMDQLLHRGQYLEIDTIKRDGPALGIKVERCMGVCANDGMVLGKTGHVGQFGFGGANGQLEDKKKWHFVKDKEKKDRPWTSFPQCSQFACHHGKCAMKFWQVPDSPLRNWGND
jgi:hypothetical protein